MDRLSFCREHLHELSFDELAVVYNLLSVEYDDGECIFKNDMEHINDMLDVLYLYNLTVKDWIDAIGNGNYNKNDQYVGISDLGIFSYDNVQGMEYFVNKKMNGEAMEMIEGFLEGKGIFNRKYVIVHDKENEEFHLHRLCNDGNPSRKMEIVGCESLHEVLELSKNLGIAKKDIVDLLDRNEIKQYS